MADFYNVGLENNPYFGAIDSGDGSLSMGGGDGSDWMGWNALDGVDVSSFYNPSQQGDNTSNGFNLDNFKTWLSQNNYSMMERPDGYRGFERGIFDSSGKNVGGIQRMGQNWIDDLHFTLGGMFLNPMGGIVTGSAGGLGGTVSSGAGAKAVNAAASGAFNTMAQGGNTSDVLKSAGTSYLGSNMPDVSQYLGITNEHLGNAVNSAARSGVTSALNGNENWGANMAASALPGLVGYGVDALGPAGGMPDVGTLGGTMQDEFGESSATLGGVAPTVQFESNAQANNVNALTEGRSQKLASNDGAFESQGFGDFMNSLIPTTPQGWGDLAQGLMGMYAGYRQRKDAKQLRDLVSGRRGAYETSLRNQLQRRDAASGRRSDYAGRETDLQASLAKLDAANAPFLAQMNNQANMGLINMLAPAIRYGGKAGWFGDMNTPMPSQSMPMLPSLQNQPVADYSLDPRKKLGGG